MVDEERAELEHEEDVARDEEREGRIIVATLSLIADASRQRNREAWLAATRRHRAVSHRAA